MPKKQKNKLNYDSIKQVIQNSAFSSLKPVEIRKALKLPPEMSQDLRHYLKLLVTDGRLIKIKHNRYAFPESQELLSGRLDIAEKGYGFVILDDPKSSDIFISEKCLNHAMHGDKVLVQFFKSSKKFHADKRVEGKVVEIIERANHKIVGTLKKGRKLYYIIPDNSRIKDTIVIHPSDINSGEPGQKVQIEIIVWPTKYNDAEAKVIKVLGFGDEPQTDYFSVCANYNLPEKFSKSILQEAKILKNNGISEQEIKSRLDLRQEIIITIDPATAKDFDDAISIKKISDHKYQVGVHIADVTYFLKAGSEIDLEAKQRANSTYLINRVIPMLPEVLSNDLCSLRPNEDKLCFSVFMDFHETKGIVKVFFAKTVICSKKRFNYEEVDDILDGKVESSWTCMIQEMLKVSQWFRVLRTENGSINLEMPERSIKLNENEQIQSIELSQTTASHQMIEDFMLAANMSVAKYLKSKRKPIISRIHEPPEDNAYLEFVALMQQFGFKLPKEFKIETIQSFFKKVEDHPAFEFLQYSYLRSLKQARYSANSSGHFALAFDDYVHFTSPIRRYADVIIHRSLAHDLGYTDHLPTTLEEYELIALHCSFQERNSMEAERKLQDMKMMRYLEQLHQKNKNHTFLGTIRNIKTSGLFIRINELLFDGMARFSDMDDFFIFDPDLFLVYGKKTGIKYKVGDSVQVKLHKIDTLTQRIDLCII